MKIHYHSDHLGSASFVTNAEGAVVQHLQYLPYGELFVSQRNSNFDTRYKFTAKELDNETSYTYFGARYYDSELSNWLSVDPLSDKYPGLSPYLYCFNNPVIMHDPDGNSGEVVLDKDKKTATVSMHLIFYGNKANTELSGKIATGVASQYNGAHGKVTIDGVKYKVIFRVSYKTVSETKAKEMASNNTDIKNNFIRVENGKGSSFTQKIGANSYYFNIDDDLSGSTTPAHEIGHGLGLDHTTSGGQTETDVPDIMEARGTRVNQRWSKIGPSNEIDPNFRRVDPNEVELIFKGIKFDKNGIGKIGTVTNKIYDENGN